MSGTLAEIRTEYLPKSLNSYSKLRNRMERFSYNTNSKLLWDVTVNNDDPLGPIESLVII